MGRDGKRRALAMAFGALGLLIWLGRDPLFAREGGAAPPDRPVAAAAGIPEAAPLGPPVAAIGGTLPAAPPAGVAKIPVIFLPNAGQTDPTVRFVAPGARGTLWFTDREVV